MQSRGKDALITPLQCIPVSQPSLDLFFKFSREAMIMLSNEILKKLSAAFNAV
jgi:hypothetical protein